MERSPLIVLAGDDEDFLMIMKLALEHATYRGVLKTVRSGGELLEFLKKIPNPGVIILDFHARPNDWRVTLNCLKGNKLHERIPVVVFCPTENREIVESCKDFQNCAYIQKPMSFEGWRKAMVDILRSYLPNSFA